MYETTPGVKAKSGAPLGSHTGGSFLTFNKKIPGVGEVPALLTVLRIDAVSYIPYYHATVLSVVVGATWAYTIMSNTIVTLNRLNVVKLEDKTVVYFHTKEKVLDIYTEDGLNVEKEHQGFKMPMSKFLDNLTSVVDQLVPIQQFLKNEFLLNNILAGATLELVREKHEKGEEIEGEVLEGDTYFTEVTSIKLNKLGVKAMEEVVEDMRDVRKDLMRKAMGL